MGFRRQRDLNGIVLPHDPPSHHDSHDAAFAHQPVRRVDRQLLE
jgi:hypothetical protein